MARVEIKHYRVSYGVSGDAIGATIRLYDARGISGGQVAAIKFRDGARETGPVWPEPTKPLDPVDINLPMSEFDRVLDLLRNERPIYFDTHRSINTAQLSSLHEPIGEEES